MATLYVKTMKQFSELAIKILAVYLVLNYLGNALPLFLAPESWSNGEPLPVAPIIGWVVVPVIAGILLWILAPQIARKLFRSTEEDTAISEKGLVVAGTFLIGVYWALKSVGVIVGQLFAMGTVNYGYVAVLVIALVLILGGRFVAIFYHRLRTAGTSV